MSESLTAIIERLIDQYENTPTVTGHSVAWEFRGLLATLDAARPSWDTQTGRAAANPAPAGLRETVLAYLHHMDLRERYADVAADIKQAGAGGPDFTVDRHFDGDGCFAELERAAALVGVHEERT